MKQHIIFLLLLYLGGTVGYAETTQPKRPVQEFYEQSGAKQAITLAAGQAQIYLQAFEKQLPPKIFSSIKPEFLSYFESQKIQDRYLVNLQSYLSADIVKTELEWIQTPLGKKIIGLERYANSDAGMNALMDHLDAPQPGLSSQRKQLLKSLARSIKGTEKAIATGLFTAVSLELKLNKLQPDAPPLNEVQIQHFINSRRAQMQPLMQQQIEAAFTFFYKDLTDQELETYLEHTGTLNTQIIHSAVLKSLENALLLKE